MSVLAKPFRVLIIGGGLGGLTLAQHLQKAALPNLSFRVFERDRSRKDRLQGYRIHIDPHAQESLKIAMPEKLVDLFNRTTVLADPGSLTTLNEKGEIQSQLWTSGSRVVSRITLRDVLLAGLDERIAYDKKFIKYEETSDGVTAFFEDGSSETGDMLVAADGAGSKVRQQFLPHAKRVETGIRAIACKIPWDDALLPGDYMHTGPAIVFSNTNRSIFIATYTKPSEDLIPKEATSDFLMDNTQPYIFASISTTDKIDLDAPKEEIRNTVLRLVDVFDSKIRILFEKADIGTLLPINIQTSEPVKHWTTGRITLLGDAIHSMTPFRGIGGNTAIQDGQKLGSAIVESLTSNKPMEETVRAYEAEMLKRGFTAVKQSLMSGQMSHTTSFFGRIFRKVFFKTLSYLVNHKWIKH